MSVFKGLKIKACNAYVVFKQSLLSQHSPLLQSLQVLWRVDSQACPSVFLPMCK